MAKPKPKTKAAFLKLERKTWDELVALTRDLPASAWKLPGAAGEWSLKDVWAHLGDWMKETRRVMPMLLRGDKFCFSITEFNRAHYARNRKLTVGEAKRRAEAERKRILALVQTLDEKQLLGNPRAYAWASFSTFNHYAEHIPALKKFRRAHK